MVSVRRIIQDLRAKDLIHKRRNWSARYAASPAPIPNPYAYTPQTSATPVPREIRFTK